MTGTGVIPEPTASLQMGAPTRDAFGRALQELGRTNERIVVVDGDVNNSTRTEWFAEEFPERFFNVGIAESNLVGVAGGLAGAGKIPVAASFACFLMCNAFDQVRMTVAFPGLNLKLVGTHAGISIGEDGPSQMGIEDVALACSLPGMMVLVPADEVETRLALEAAIEHKGPVYIRVGRGDVPIIYEATDQCPFVLGKAIRVRDGSDVTLIVNGLMVAVGVDAHRKLAKRGISARVLDMATVKPIDLEALLTAAEETGALVVGEEHLAHGGLGSVVAMALAENRPTPLEFVNLGDRYAESGPGNELLTKYGLTGNDLVEAAERVIARK